MNVVVVESPAKARTINKYLGPDYTVVASYGHVRDLPAKDGSVRPDQDFEMDWEVAENAEKRIRDIAKALKGADHLYLATDPDREGEAISWHVREVLRHRKALARVDVKRVVFHEVTRNAVLDAMAHPRELNRELIEAYLARRALDYLVGFTLSPVLWRKVPGARSAGRVQSVALRLICEREAEIELFRPREYWTVDATFANAAGQPFIARLTHLDGSKLDKFSLDDEAAAGAAVAAVEAQDFAVAKVERKTVKRHPQPPFTTSTLQQEASRKLGFGASRTMKLAQRLYEGTDLGGESVGLITYMRTDSVQLSAEAVAAGRRLIEDRYGQDYLPEKPRVYTAKAKNAQEAHEAIRPTDFFRQPSEVARFLDKDQARLYELIWKRAVASGMASAVFDQVAVDVGSPDRQVALRATGSVLRFDGFLKLYQEGRDDEAEDEAGERRLPPVTEAEPLARREVTPEQHFTQPPPRFTEASLVKKLEELGIGRPSTYASIIQVLQDRQYVKLVKRRFEPEDRGRVVTAFLQSFFERYVQYNFTAELEQRLDDISGGRIDWKSVLRDFWGAFSEAVDGTKGLSIAQVVEALDQDLGPHFFPPRPDGEDPRACSGCGTGRLGLKLGKYGAFIGCTNYPECRFTRPLAIANGNGDGAGNGEGATVLGAEPGTGQQVSLRQGPYGHYLQLGEAANGQKPKRAALPRGLEPADVDLDKALALLALPREVGPHPETGEPITAGIGRFGPYIKMGATYKSLGRGDDVLSIGLNRAVVLLAEAKAKAARSLGAHPDDGKPVTVRHGRYGPYAAHGGLRASLPRGKDADSITLDEAVALLAAKAGKGGGKAAKGGGKATGKSGGSRRRTTATAKAG
jgi:DNA topoisomerase-1